MKSKPRSEINQIRRQRNNALTYRGRQIYPEDIRALKLELLQEQDYRCPICQHEINMSDDLDHDHLTGEIRGMLCAKHNRGIGFFSDDPALLARAIEYLTGLEILLERPTYKTMVIW